MNILPPAPAIAGMVPAQVIPEALHIVRLLKSQNSIIPKPGNATAACQALARAGVLAPAEPGRWTVAKAGEVIL